LKNESKNAQEALSGKNFLMVSSLGGRVIKETMINAAVEMRKHTATGMIPGPSISSEPKPLLAKK
jgi:hypothetical protein|tara:strand:- start:9 stop:203 length:195 start_codon:yes stop_codon:yes gene_type:complete